MVKCGAVAAIACIFLPIIGQIIAASTAGFIWCHTQDKTKKATTKEKADALLLKTLDHYGLVRLLDNDQGQLVNE